MVAAVTDRANLKPLRRAPQSLRAAPPALTEQRVDALLALLHGKSDTSRPTPPLLAVDQEFDEGEIEELRRIFPSRTRGTEA